MKRQWMQILALVVFLCIFCVSGWADSSQRMIILVSGQNSKLDSLSPIEVRKLFLGIPVLVDEQPLVPLRNYTDPLLTEVFLQKILFMSEYSYERQLLSRVFRQGGKRPIKYTNKDELLAKLNSKAEAVTYMWSDDAAGLKQLGVLWSGSVN